MTEETMVARTVINAAADTVFDLLADPSTHASIDGTGWVRKPVDGDRLTGTGQIFRMGMYHDNHPPNKDYEMANRSRCSIGHVPSRGSPERNRATFPVGKDSTTTPPVEYGGWLWRYHLEPVGTDQTEVTLTYDWSRVPRPRDIEFPPFPPRQHLDNSLTHLAELAERG